MGKTTMNDDGMLLIAAAGNQKEGEVEYPAAYDEVLAVGSSDATGNKTDDTSDGKEIEIFAPGSQIITTGLFGGTLVTEGTSIATAQVSGAASLLWSLDKDKDAGFIRSLLVSTTQKMEFTGQSDGGLLDIENAMQQYDALEKVYQLKVLEYIDLQSDSVAEDFRGIELINGSWTQDNHDEMAKYTVKGTNPKEIKESKSVHSYDAMFGYGDFKEQSTHQIESDSKLKMWAKGSYNYKDSICKRWKCFQRTVNLGVMEFKDIKNYVIKNQKQYEDNANFCKERYVDAKLACVMLFGSFYEKDSFDGVYILFPTEENVKLNNLKNYAKEAGEDTSILTSEEWKNVSTPEFY